MSAEPYEFRSILTGVETIPAGRGMARHHHNEGYATILLGGSLTEVSFAGRMHAEPGHVLLHGRFDCHMDIARGRRPLEILRLPWRHDTIEGQFYVTDPDALARLAEINPERAAAQLREDLRVVAPRDRYWVDELAGTLRDGSSLQLQVWAETRGLRPDTVSYIFQREFGVCPKRFRLECRTRLAWREIMRSTSTLTDIAFKVGFSDLAHLSRSIHVLTGRSPSNWRSIQAASRLAHGRAGVRISKETARS